MRVAAAEADAGDVAVPDAGSVVPRQPLAHAVVVPARGVPRRADGAARLARHRAQRRVQPLPRVAQVQGRGAAAERHARQAARVSNEAIAPRVHTAAQRSARRARTAPAAKFNVYST